MNEVSRVQCYTTNKVRKLQCYKNEVNKLQRFTRTNAAHFDERSDRIM